MIGEYTKVSANCQFAAVEAREEYEYLFAETNMRSRRNRLILECVFRDGLTYGEAGKGIGKGRERVRQIIVEAVRLASRKGRLTMVKP